MQIFSYSFSKLEVSKVSFLISFSIKFSVDFGQKSGNFAQTWSEFLQCSIWDQIFYRNLVSCSNVPKLELHTSSKFSGPKFQWKIWVCCKFLPIVSIALPSSISFVCQNFKYTDFSEFSRKAPFSRDLKVAVAHWYYRKFLLSRGHHSETINAYSPFSWHSVPI